MAIAALISIHAAHAGEDVLVFAAASLRDVMQEAAGNYGRDGGESVRMVYAASSVLARQIEAGAPASLFISADEDWVGWLAGRGVIDREKIRIVAGNALVVAANADSAPKESSEVLTSGRFAMGDPSHVPAGRYAEEALRHLGLWEIVRPHAVFGENVRVALEFLRRGEVDAAVVYASDLNASPELFQAYVFPEDSHAPIRYAAAPVSSANGDAAGFLEYLLGEQGQALFAKHGFKAVR